MDNPSYGLSERPLGALNGSGTASSRRPGSHPSSTSSLDNSYLQSVILTIHRDETGYGMKVSGDNPVYVQSVKDGGAAEKAGLQSGDIIIKVNGTLVTHSTHTQVVELIKSAAQVELTVHPRGQTQSGRSFSTVSSPTTPVAPVRPLHHHPSAPARSTEHITGPQPVDIEKKRQLECQRVQTFEMMLDRELLYIESLRSEYARTNNSKTAQELSGAERRVGKLQELLKTMKTSVEQATAPLPPSAASAVHSHHRTKSSPDPLGLNHPAGSENSKRLSTSESVSSLNSSTKRPKSGGSGWEESDSPQITPPGTPPPPYGGAGKGENSTNLNRPNGSSDAAQAHQVDEVGFTKMSLIFPGVPATTAAAFHQFIPSEQLLHRMSSIHSPSGVISPNDFKLFYSQSWPLQQQQPLCGTPPDNSYGPFCSRGVQLPILPMEEDDLSDQEMNNLQDHGVFKSLSKLWEHNAHLAVFLNYVMSHSDPSSLLFYLITDLYKEGNAKEMKKWAYEILSSFLVPKAPLMVDKVDENIVREVDEVLRNESDKEDQLRRVFRKARAKAREDLNEQLLDFQQKRSAGLGLLFGPSDHQLDESDSDKNKEMKIVDSLLLPHFETLINAKSDLEEMSDRNLALAAAFATVLGKVFGVRTPQANSLIERCPTFVSKDKSLKSRLIGKSRKPQSLKGHHFVAQQYYLATYCNHCQLIIWGVGPQGYQCTNCTMNIHRGCVKVVEENCALIKKERGNDRISKLMDKIRNPEKETRRKPSQLNVLQIEKAKKQHEDKEDAGNLTDSETAPGDRLVSGGRGERRPDPVSEERPHHDDVANHKDEFNCSTPRVLPRKPSGTSINRSESYKERVQKRQLRERRKTSDPNLSKTSDVDLESQGLSYNNSGSSSNSSLSTSRSLDSPSNSLEMVSSAAAPAGVTLVPTPSSGTAEFDSDIEAEPDPPDWTKNVPEDVLRQLKPKEKKRQEVINELFHTEKSHVRNLKVLDQVFYRPLLEQQVLPPDFVHLLFPNLDKMIDIHSKFNQAMKACRRENPLVGDIGDILLEMFDYPYGETLQNAASTFCARQQIALEALRERRKKDQKVNGFLTDAEGNPMCRRLQLKDIIPTGMLRLTKYPLLFENLVKYTPPTTTEHASVIRSLERSKEILNAVNQAVKEAEDCQRLGEIQRRLDKSAFEKADQQIAADFRNLDLTKHRLIHEGQLTWRISTRQKQIDLHVVLLEEFIVLLQKQDEKYILKQHSVNFVSGKEDTKLTHSPIIRYSTVLVRPVATDKRAFFLVNTSQVGAQIYELVASSSSERKMWFKHISDAAESYKQREGKGRRLEQSPTSPSEADKTKESEESGETWKEAAEPEDVAPVEPGQALSGASSSSAEEAESAKVTPQEPSPTPTPSASPPETLAQKTGEPPLPPSSPSVPRRPKQVDVLRLTEEASLIQPSEVVVSQGAVLTAEPVLTPIEKLRRKDEVIRSALSEKQRLVADILHIPTEDFETIADMAGEPASDKDARELILAALLQAKRLTDVVNESLRVTEEEAVCAASETSPRIGRRTVRMPGVPSQKVTVISSTLQTQLSQLLSIISEREEERERLRRELQRSREQLHLLHESRRRAASPQTSRPNSFISLGSSCDAGSDPQHDSDEEAGVPKLTDPQETPLNPLEPENPATETKPLVSSETNKDDSGPEVYVDAVSEVVEPEETLQSPKDVQKPVEEPEGCL